ncbi:MAG: hypothetical protein U5K37_08205 [Natrialbaceae archaeon]|nr:hypothetical protein [Natrialbaceae archaeon]
MSVTVLLLGIGADATNCEPSPRVYPDERFDYIPIPEKNGPDGTTESVTYGTWPISGDRTAADYLQAIRPTPNGSRQTGAALTEWPVHHDPNFQALTYGETSSRAAYVNAIRRLDPGDIVASTPAWSAESRYRHRYLIGWFTVDHVLDCQAVSWEGTCVQLSDLPPDEQTRIMQAHETNAHAKRFLETGELRASEDGLVIVEGRQPGGLLERAIKLSDRRSGGHYYLTQELIDALEPVKADPYLGGIKQVHTLQADRAFLDLIGA